MANHTVNPGELLTKFALGAAGDEYNLIGTSGTFFFFSSGIDPRAGDRFYSETGAVLYGGRLLSSWGTESGAYVATGQTQQGTRTLDAYWASSPRCNFPEDLYFNGVILQHVDSFGAGGSGKWFFDYANDKIFIWDNPGGNYVETTVADYCFGGSADDVTIEGFRIEMFANPSQQGAIQGDGEDWIVRNNEIRRNHGYGIGLAAGRQVTGNYVHHNGQMGIAGNCSDGLVADNEIAYNNTAAHDPYWEAGGTKFANTTGLTVSGNFCHHNYGPGLWSDIDNSDILYEYNICDDNQYEGIFHEISFDCIIRYNTCRRNGTMQPSGPWIAGAGILIGNSQDVEVYGNYVEHNWQAICCYQTDRGSYPDCVNIAIHDNDVVSDGNVPSGGWAAGYGGRSGLLIGAAGYDDWLDPSYSNMWWYQNDYYLGGSSAKFLWAPPDYNHINTTLVDWQTLGQDVGSTFNGSGIGAPPTAPMASLVNAEANSEAPAVTTIATNTARALFAGNGAFVGVRWALPGGGGTTCTVVDSTGTNVYVHVATAVHPSGDRLSLFYCANCAGHASNIWTATIGGTGGFFRDIVAAQFASPSANAFILDQAVEDSVTSGSNITSPAYTTTRADELIITLSQHGGSVGTWTPPSGASVITDAVATYTMLAYEVASAIRTSRTETVSSSLGTDERGIVVGTFKLVG